MYQLEYYKVQSGKVHVMVLSYRLSTTQRSVLSTLYFLIPATHQGRHLPVQQ